MKKAIVIVLGIYVAVAGFIAFSAINSAKKIPSNQELIAHTHKVVGDTYKLIDESKQLLGSN